MKLQLLLTVFFGAFISFANAQVQYHIQWLEGEQAYQVSLISEATWLNPSNITGSGQVSLKAPAGMLDVYNLKNLQNEVSWELSSQYDAPEESPDFDYISFGLASMGTAGIEYKTGVEVPLFTFQNAGDCAGEVELVKNETELFMPPNKSKANIGNQLTVLGAGGNALTGIFGTGKAVCKSQTYSITSGLAPQTSFEIFPTNVQSKVNIRFDWTEVAQEVDIRLYEANGKLVKTQSEALLNGLNQISLSAEKLRSGLYFIEMEADGKLRTIGKFMRM